MVEAYQVMASLIYLFVVDTHSQWPEIIEMSSTIAQRTIANISVLRMVCHNS